MARAAVLISAMLAACGRIGFDAPPDATPLGDADPPTGPFAPPTLVTALSSPGDDDDPTLTSDLLEVFFTSTRSGGAGGEDIWTATRASVNASWSPPVPVSEINSTTDDLTPHISGDGLTLYFASWRTGQGNQDLWRTTRPTRRAPWATPTPVVELNTADAEVYPAVSASGLILMFASTKNVDFDLFQTTRTSTAMPWGPPVALAELNSSADDSSPTIDRGGKLVLFDSNRPGAARRDLYMASRPTVTDPFGAPLPITELNSAANESDPCISDDLRYLLFSSDRGGSTDIYETSR